MSDDRRRRERLMHRIYNSYNRSAFSAERSVSSSVPESPGYNRNPNSKPHPTDRTITLFERLAKNFYHIRIFYHYADANNYANYANCKNFYHFTNRFCPSPDLLW